MMASELIAYCGLYCGACSFKVAYEEGDREHILRMPQAYDYLKADPPEPCPGCRLENLCGPCPIRECARGKHVDHCGLCADFPCEILTRFNDDGKPHHAHAVENLRALLAQGEEAWLSSMKARWTCGCGKRLSWYHTACGCGSIPFDLRAKRSV